MLHVIPSLLPVCLACSVTIQVYKKYIKNVSFCSTNARVDYSFANIPIEYLSAFFTMGLNERLVYEEDLKGSHLG